MLSYLCDLKRYQGTLYHLALKSIFLHRLQFKKSPCTQSKVCSHLTLFCEFSLAKFSNWEFCIDFAKGLSWSCRFTAFTSRKMLGLNVTSV